MTFIFVALTQLTLYTYLVSYISFEGKEICLRQPFEVLVGNASHIRWVSGPCTLEDARTAPSVRFKALHAVEGGRELDGTVLLLVQAYRKDFGWQPEKFSTTWKTCEIPWCGNTCSVPHFRVMVWAEWILQGLLS